MKNLPEEMKDLLEKKDKDTSSSVPEWKWDFWPKDVGFWTKLSLKEQQESLPIYKLKKEFKKAIKENKILVVIGETGSGKST